MTRGRYVLCVSVGGPLGFRPLEGRFSFSLPFVCCSVVIGPSVICEISRGRSEIGVSLLSTKTGPLTPGELWKRKCLSCIFFKTANEKEGSDVLCIYVSGHVPLPLSHSLTYGTPGLVSFLSWISTSTFGTVAGAGGPTSSSSSFLAFSAAGATREHQTWSKNILTSFRNNHQHTDTCLICFKAYKDLLNIQQHTIFFIPWLQLAFLYPSHPHFSESSFKKGFPLILQLLAFAALFCGLRRKKKL